MKRVLILDGHPDPEPKRFVHALASAYRDGAQAAGHEVLITRLADLEFPWLRTQSDYKKGEPVESVRRVQADFNWANHVVILYPLWLGDMPAMLKGLLEQMLRPGFAFSYQKSGRWPIKLHAGKSARVIVTTGMPALIYRLWYRAHSLRIVQRNILKFIGFQRIDASLIGSMESMNDDQRRAWLDKLRKPGRRAQ